MVPNAFEEVPFRESNNGALIGEQLVRIMDAAPTLVDVSWAAIDRLEIASTHDSGFLVDNFQMG